MVEWWKIIRLDRELQADEVKDGGGWEEKLNSKFTCSKDAKIFTSLKLFYSFHPRLPSADSNTDSTQQSKNVRARL